MFDYDGRKERLAEVLLRLEDPGVWNNPQEAQQLGQERASLEASTTALDDLAVKTGEASELLALAREEGDEESVDLISLEADQALGQLEKLEFLRMFSGELDSANAFLDIQAGSGGTEAQDWADMLLRMYLRWAEDEGLAAELVERSDGEVAGIKSATIHVKGEYAFGKLRTETGVHRLVRKSPFDSG
ncbi:MAG: PCRF domain-containing protein, partial [Proteobacteria bacterium]|nr:PCRF domain-containing protein [Pseudomonadota bacterium]